MTDHKRLLESYFDEILHILNQPLELPSAGMAPQEYLGRELTEEDYAAALYGLLLVKKFMGHTEATAGT